MNKFCIVCGKRLIGRQRTLCSEKCRKEQGRRSSRKWRQNNLDYQSEYYQNNRDKDNKRSRSYYQVNQKRLIEYNREYRQSNPEKVKESSRKWRQNNPDYQQEYRQNNREKERKRLREYYQDNMEKIKEYQQEYRQNNRGKRLGYEHRRYRRNLGFPEDADLHKESSLERIMREWLQENNIEFVPQYYINLENSTWTWVDFYIPELNICLYCDGGYHHLLSDIKKRDENQNRILPQMGYKVIRLSETDILNGVRPDLK